MTTAPLPLSSRAPLTYPRVLPARHAISTMSLLVTLCLFSALLGRGTYLIRPFDSDSSMFIYAGKLAADGQSLCHDLIDNKLPTVGLMMSAPWRIAGAHWQPYVLMQLAMGLATTAILWRMARRHIGPAAGIATALFALVYLNLNCIVFGGFQLETPQTLLATLAASAALDALAADGPSDIRDAALVGLAAATAALLKPTALAVLAAFLACALTQCLHHDPPARLTRRLTRFARLTIAALAGAAIPAAVAAVYITATNDWPNIAPRIAQIASYAKHSAWDNADWTKPLIAIMFPGFPMIIRWRVFRSPDRRTTERARPAIVAFVLTWLALETLGIISQRRMYAYHFMPLIPPLALLFGMIPRKAQAGPLLAALLPAMIINFSGASETIAQSFRWTDRTEASTYLINHALPGDAVWQDDAARLLIETNLRPGSRVILTFLFGNDDQAPLTFGQVILTDLATRRPRFVLLPTTFDAFLDRYVKGSIELARNPQRAANFKTAWQQIRQYTLARYHKVALANGNDIYERNNPRPPTPN